MATTMVQTPVAKGARTRPAATTIPPPSPGTWRHPKFTEIVTRQSASTFSSSNLRRAGLNILGLILSFALSSPIYNAFNTTSTALTISDSTAVIGSTSTVWFARIYLLANIALALRPLFLPTTDQITDIPLTPTQRSLLGLDPSSSPATPQSGGYITPPRYRRSSGSFSGSNLGTPTSDRRSISATYYSSSPLSASQNFSPGAALSPFRSPSRSGASQFSPSASPLLHKAVAKKNNNHNNRDSLDPDRRQSFGTPGSGLARSQSLRERAARGAESPTPSAGARRSPGMNYKWLYEKGSRLPRSETMQF